ncbi:MAG: glycerophosphodiester phosphodiesterase family protein [Clostridia bacterium]|nr:glycerophosphodiester phosphodiesterase family protein [Clostridia bacterium]
MTENIKKRIISVFSAASLLIGSLGLFACTGVSDVVTEPETTVETVETYVLDIADASTPFSVIRPDNCSSEITELFTELNRTLRDFVGNTLTVATDWLQPGKEPAEYEILVGRTNRPETEEALHAIRNTEWTCRVVGRKIVLAGATDAGTAEAVKYFTEVLLPSGTAFTSLMSHTGKLDYPISSVSVNGKNISDYTLCSESGTAFSSSAEFLKNFLETEAASVLGKGSIKDEIPGRIIVSSTGADGKKLGYDDTQIFFKNGCLYISGGSKWSVDAAVNVFISDCLSSSGDISLEFTEGQIFRSLLMPERDAYIKDPSLMPVHWAGLWAPSDELIDYGAKIDCLMAVNKDHIFTVSHRADYLYYPENSIEAMISVWAMGGDCVEIDIHYTRDGVPVVMHDATLTRTTDFAAKAGKNGLPLSNKISDWTLAQLRELRLLEGAGGTSAAVTPYLIPTLEESLIAAKGRFFIILDKANEWRYVDYEGLQPNSAPNYIFPYMQSTGNFESVLISYGTLDTTPAGTLDASEALKIQKYVYDKTGEKMYFYLRGWTTRSTADPYAKTLKKSSLTNSAILVNGAFDPTNSSVLTQIKSLVKNNPDCMFGGWTIDTNGYDCEKYWDVMYGAGLRSIMTNRMFYLVQYAGGVLAG